MAGVGVYDQLKKVLQDVIAPDLHAIPDGCVYQARCPLAREICATTRPALAGGDRKAACHFPEEVINV